jgi:hypothetical protein
MHPACKSQIIQNLPLQLSRVILPTSDRKHFFCGGSPLVEKFDITQNKAEISSRLFFYQIKAHKLCLTISLYHVILRKAQEQIPISAEQINRAWCHCWHNIHTVLEGSRCIIIVACFKIRIG